MKIGALCKACGVTARTVRFYEECGFLQPVQKEGSAHKFYTQQAADIINSIRALQETGYSLDTIKGLLTLSKSKKTREKWLTLRLRAELEKQASLLADKIALLQKSSQKVNDILQGTSGCPSCPSADCAGCDRLKRLRSLGGMS